MTACTPDASGSSGFTRAMTRSCLPRFFAGAVLLLLLSFPTVAGYPASPFAENGGETGKEAGDRRQKPPGHFYYPTRTKTPFSPLYKESLLFTQAMERAKDTPPVKVHGTKRETAGGTAGRTLPGRRETKGIAVSGITLPHHLLAVDLMAEGFAALEGRRYSRIILISPDHFKRGKTPFTVPGRDFLTCLGPVALDRRAAETLLQNPLVSESNLFSHEHGVQALLPFIARYFPGTPVLPVSLGVYSRKEQWDELAASLLPLLEDDTLLVQSTDFSHYLPWEEARKKDQETLRAIISGDPAMILRLNQPAHLDSKAGQYLQMLLQKKRYNAFSTVTANHNACEFLPQDQRENTPGNPMNSPANDPSEQPGEQTKHFPAGWGIIESGKRHAHQAGMQTGSSEPPAGGPDRTTSYIVQFYAPAPLALPQQLPRIMLAGDFFTGRHMNTQLQAPHKRAYLVDRILGLTQGAPLIVNFEGALQKNCPPSGEAGTKEALRLCMPEKETLALLRDLGVRAASLANNHSHDLGQDAYDYTKQRLAENGILPLEQGQVYNFGTLRLTALTDFDNAPVPRRGLITQKLCAALKKAAGTKPLVALVHCGREFFPAAGPQVRDLAGMLEQAGVEVFAGAHPHRAGMLEAGMSGIRAWSLGNLVFDQTRSGADGALLELVFFPQGTYWARQINTGPLYRELLELQ